QSYRPRYRAVGACGLSRPDPLRPAVRTHRRADPDAPVRRHRPGRLRRTSILHHRRGSGSVNGMTRIHLIGVCGTAMATLAALLKSRGYDVRGSDQNVYPPMSNFLREQGITTLQGYRAEHVSADIDLVVVGNAISRGNPELEEVLDRKIRYCSLPEAVRDHFLWGARSIVIAGTHGKTT